MTKLCSRCRKYPRRGNSYCRDCQRARRLERAIQGHKRFAWTSNPSQSTR